MESGRQAMPRIGRLEAVGKGPSMIRSMDKSHGWDVLTLMGGVSRDVTLEYDSDEGVSDGQEPAWDVTLKGE